LGYDGIVSEDVQTIYPIHVGMLDFEAIIPISYPKTGTRSAFDIDLVCL